MTVEAILTAKVLSFLFNATKYAIAKAAPAVETVITMNLRKDGSIKRYTTTGIVKVKIVKILQGRITFRKYSFTCIKSISLHIIMVETTIFNTARMIINIKMATGEKSNSKKTILRGMMEHNTIADAIFIRFILPEATITNEIGAWRQSIVRAMRMRLVKGTVKSG